MGLEKVSLRGRRFSIQFFSIMQEFGGVIPWLDGMDEMRFATDGHWFQDAMRSRFGGEVTPYQFVADDDASTFVGGILHFDKAPERMRDCQNLALAEYLEAKGVNFISCLQVRDPMQGRGLGSAMTRRAIDVIIKKHGPVWGVVSNPKLLPWYVALGANTPSPPDNRDSLWIVDWSHSAR
ncbi:hypothetical protein CO057_04235 [Candidatus Uhrbacteria bacterium CG_4_9_14_0_2_um_filter_41_50]|uniref:N-acetyltransferase domain-containing protein n=1 Tax=Candidatus Uhrbacteria bacterium CG_4_9_14_0_2_um_filter_41_50 TaxID=1975031 RepID=A0A2M8ENC9_9BACT|nr:MAG: hypothetical protein COZ45_03465 [Candidatus Uhrbacteria bacterium CG_4_10_14_3_um_filter_41_21]PIZ55043.1 MAG: hypothetical protein COY24_01880 [Candidatus Uhrbacteria bacterium CG_4_10_14_0_2_um_filter_41_21]PJB84312.1 MAG: hypothetical protein CO086_04270 [Candidatus Uhrbacteria bacterium CG_4_9_14_0_8_um_filter_41_16]PJC24177.1 MAG: hypothetical protein CO057_04235 [Candidatus Uhrbacteria bacterium CG_4_9_14_0_2_um_filter_41_50]PJE75174.1 MAG: hypothetical protein COV03_01560 [Candi